VSSFSTAHQHILCHSVPENGVEDVINVYLKGIRVKFVCEGHSVKVKVTGGKKSKIPILAM